MTDFDDRMADAFEFLLAEFGEPVEYHPLNGPPRLIDAIVIREPPRAVPGLSRGVKFQPTIQARYSDSTGLDPACVNTGGDQIKVARRKGGAAELINISHVQNQDGAVRVSLV